MTFSQKSNTPKLNMNAHNKNTHTHTNNVHCPNPEALRWIRRCCWVAVHILMERIGAKTKREKITICSWNADSSLVRFFEPIFRSRWWWTKMGRSVASNSCFPNRFIGKHRSFLMMQTENSTDCTPTKRTLCKIGALKPTPIFCVKSATLTAIHKRDVGFRHCICLLSKEQTPHLRTTVACGWTTWFFCGRGRLQVWVVDRWASE